MKSPFLAFLLSFFLPGAGLAYLGFWKAALLNFILALAIGVILAFVLPDSTSGSYLRYVAFGLAGGSGAYAQQRAKLRNADLKTNHPV